MAGKAGEKQPHQLNNNLSFSGRVVFTTRPIFFLPGITISKTIVLLRYPSGEPARRPFL